MTDFRIVGLEIKQLGWKWGTVREVVGADDPDSTEGSGEEEEEEQDEKVDADAGTETQQLDVKAESGANEVKAEAPAKVESANVKQTSTPTSSKDNKDAVPSVVDNAEEDAVKVENGVEQDALESTCE
jgi:hypothetical protein